jgi:hypothetical protein
VAQGSEENCSCEHSNKSSVSKKDREFLGNLRDCYPVKKTPLRGVIQLHIYVKIFCTSVALWLQVYG